MIGPSVGLDWLARRAHPRLAAIAIFGAALAVGGAALELAHVGPTRLGYRLAVTGLIVMFFGGSGAIAFYAFERGFE